MSYIVTIVAYSFSSTPIWSFCFRLINQQIKTSNQQNYLLALISFLCPHAVFLSYLFFFFGGEAIPYIFDPLLNSLPPPRLMAKKTQIGKTWNLSQTRFAIRSWKNAYNDSSVYINSWHEHTTKYTEKKQPNTPKRKITQQNDS